MDYRKKGTLILTSLLEGLVISRGDLGALHTQRKTGISVEFMLDFWPH